jgi:hypothetical protein
MGKVIHRHFYNAVDFWLRLEISMEFVRDNHESNLLLAS